MIKNCSSIFAFLFLFMPILTSANILKIGANTLNLDYVETKDDGTFLDSETTGWEDIGGVELSYSLPMGDGNGGADESSLEASLSYVKGVSDYNGFLQSNGTLLGSYKNDTDIEIIETEIRWVETKHTKDFDLSTFVSLGYRYWLRENSHDIYRIKEEYKWMYFNVGLKSLFHDENWHVGLEFAYQRAVNPSLFADIKGGLDFDLGTTDGYYYKIPLIYDINDKYSIELSYKYDYWKIEKSNVVQGFYEPDSETKNKIVTLSLVMEF